jgi:hypothetical protein
VGRRIRVARQATTLTGGPAMPRALLATLICFADKWTTSGQPNLASDRYTIDISYNNGQNWDRLGPARRVLICRS